MVAALLADMTEVIGTWYMNRKTSPVMVSAMASAARRMTAPVSRWTAQKSNASR
jgi:hypothetical protein